MAFRIITLLTFIYSQFIQAQDPYSINYSIEDGIPTSNIYSVFQEENGIIWFTTDVGIVKYNSKTFELINTNNGLSDNEVFKMNLDAKNRIWMLTLNGKSCYIYKSKIYNNQNNSLLKKIKGNGMCLNYFIDSKKTLYFTYSNGEIVSLDKNNIVKNYNLKSSSISGVWEDNDEIYAFSSPYIYNISKNKIHKKLNLNKRHRLFHLNKSIYTTDGINLYTLNKDKIEIILQLDKEHEIINVVEDTENSIWICTRKGIFQLKNGLLSKPFFEDYIISSILKDFEGNYWISTLNKGVLFVPSFNIIQYLKGIKTNSLGTNNNELWIGGEFNNYYIKNRDSIHSYNLNKNWRKNKILKIRFFNNKPYIIGKSGLKIINSSKNEEYQLGFNDILLKNSSYFLGTDYTAKLLIEELKKINLDTVHKKSILNKRTNVICEGKNNDIWIGTNFGLFKYNPKDSISDYSKNSSFLDTSIEDLFFDYENNFLLVATSSKGLVVLKNNRVVKNFNINNNLNSNTCTSIKKIKKGSYLIGSNNGLNLIDLQKNEITNLNPTIGIKNKRIKDIETINNTSYLATDHGVLSFEIDYLKSKFVKPKCIISALKNEDGLITKKIEDYKKRDISVTFNGISFIDNGDVNYYYQLENQDEKWSFTKETQVNYKSLPPNKYVFKVYCVNGFGIKSDIQKISFEIVPPFWQKLWFKFIVFSFLSLLIFLFIRIRLKKQQIRFEEEKLKIKRERDKATLEKQMIELEQKALRMQMNPHFIFNALNTIKGYYSEGNDEKAGDYISNFSMLLRMLLENTEPVIALSTEIKMLELYIDLTKIRYKNSFQYEINVEKEISKDETSIPTLLLQPIVENAIIHGLSPKKENGILHIGFNKKGNQLECIVEDNVIGIKASTEKQKHKQHESKAIEITKERIELLEGEIKSELIIEDLYDKSNNPTGTKVTIRIPFKNIW